MENEIKKLVKFCVTWKGDDPKYEEWLLKQTVDDIMKLIEENES